MKYDVFISYSRKDIKIADKICKALDNAGISYFIDRESIGGGKDFPKMLADKIINSTIFLLIASKNAYNAKYTPKEIYFAIDEKPSETILPYIVDKSQFPPEYKLAFANIDWLTIEEHPIEPKLVDDLLKLLGRERSKPQLFLNRKFSITNFIFEAVQAYIAARSACRTITNKFKYDHIGLCYEGLTIVKKHNKYGYINEVGTIAIPLLFDSAEDFHNGKAKVILNDEVFYIDKNGNRVE